MRIALVEPSRTVQRIVTGIIEPWGHEVRTFMDAPEALACLQAERDVCVLITSAELVSTSGVQLVSDARALAGAQRPLYIVLMSSSDQRSKMIQALENGADDFISKPPAPEELRARLRAGERITSMQAELIALATIDSLTGLLTRRAFVAAAERMVERAMAGRHFSVLICDLDKFKAINDTYGHETGDLVLRKVSEELRAIDVPTGRLGGEEVALLTDGHLDDAVDLAERIREVGQQARHSRRKPDNRSHLQRRRGRMGAGRHYRHAVASRRCGALRGQTHRAQSCRRGRQLCLVRRAQALARNRADGGAQRRLKRRPRPRATHGA